MEGRDLQQWRKGMQQWLPISVPEHLLSETAISTQISDFLRMWSLLPTLAPLSCMHTSSMLLELVHSCLPWGWKVGNRWMLLSQDLKLTEINHNSLVQASPTESASLQWTPEFQNSYIRQILLVQPLSTQEDLFLLLPTLLSDNPSLIAHTFKIHCLANGHLDRLQFIAIRDKGAINILVYNFLRGYILIYTG